MMLAKSSVAGVRARTSSLRVPKPSQRGQALKGKHHSRLLLAKAQPSGKEQKASEASRDNRSTQLNPNSPNYQGGSTQYQGTGTKTDLDNHSQQLNPNNPKHKSPNKQ